MTSFYPYLLIVFFSVQAFGGISVQVFSGIPKCDTILAQSQEQSPISKIVKIQSSPRVTSLIPQRNLLLTVIDNQLQLTDVLSGEIKSSFTVGQRSTFLGWGVPESGDVNEAIVLSNGTQVVLQVYWPTKKLKAWQIWDLDSGKMIKELERLPVGEWGNLLSAKSARESSWSETDQLERAFYYRYNPSKYEPEISKIFFWRTEKTIDVPKDLTLKSRNIHPSENAAIIIDGKFLVKIDLATGKEIARSDLSDFGTDRLLDFIFYPQGKMILLLIETISGELNVVSLDDSNLDYLQLHNRADLADIRPWETAQHSTDWSKFLSGYSSTRLYSDSGRTMVTFHSDFDDGAREDRQGHRMGQVIPSQIWSHLIVETDGWRKTIPLTNELQGSPVAHYTVGNKLVVLMYYSRQYEGYGHYLVVLNLNEK